MNRAHGPYEGHAEHASRVRTWATSLRKRDTDHVIENICKIFSNLQTSKKTRKVHWTHSGTEMIHLIPKVDLKLDPNLVGNNINSIYSKNRWSNNFNLSLGSIVGTYTMSWPTSCLSRGKSSAALHFTNLLNTSPALPSTLKGFSWSKIFKPISAIRMFSGL